MDEVECFPDIHLSNSSLCIYDIVGVGPKLSQLPTSNLSKVKATTVVVAGRDHEEEEVGTNPYEEYTS
jgi:hypothetical protein